MDHMYNSQDPSKLPYAVRAVGEKPKFFIYSGKSKNKIVPSTGSTSKKLILHNIVYETLVEGISDAVGREDFRGLIGISYTIDNEEYHIVFALWYAKKENMYFLTSLGQYSSSSYRKAIENFQKNAFEDKYLHIKLAPIHKSGLDDLENKLLMTNLSKASVFLLKDTISSAQTLSEGRKAFG